MIYGIYASLMFQNMYKYTEGLSRDFVDTSEGHILFLDVALCIHESGKV